MKALICGDIHGNLIALEKILRLESGNYDIFVCHGDIVNYGPWSNECFDLIHSLSNRIVLKGNHEVDFIKGSYSGANLIAKSFFNFCFPRFDRFELLNNMEESFILDIFSIQHTINNLYVFPDSDLNTIMEKENRSYIIGHSHHQFSYKSKKNNFLYNTGSLGQNRTFINLSNYIMYDSNKNKIELKSSLFDVSLLISEMINWDYPFECINYYKSKKQL